MSSPSQRRGGCGHMMAGFDLHNFCARCCDKKKGKDPCVEKPNVECQLCKALTPEQETQLATPSYKLRRRSVIKRNLHHLRRIHLLLSQSLSVPPLWTRHECR